MMNEKGKYSVFLTLVGIPFSLVVSLIVIYTAMFGFQLPFEIQFKTKTTDGKLLSEKELKDYRFVLIDSVLNLRKEITSLKKNASEIQLQVSGFQDSLLGLQMKKTTIDSEISTMQTQLSSLNDQRATISAERMAKLSNILKSLSQDQLDSLYVASLDDQTIMAIIDMAKSQQAAAVFQHVEPRRAAKLTAKYIYVKNQ